MLHHALAAAALAVCCGAATAHDTWFANRPGAAGWGLALGTGNQFPLQETGVGAEYLVRQGCAGGLGLSAVADGDHALWLEAPAAAQDCWVQLAPFEVELAPDKIPLYLREVNPTPEIRAAWSAMQARGLPWRERYTKHARVVRPGTAPTVPSGLGLDVVLESEAPLRFRVLRDGVPLPQFAVEFRHEAARFGFWRRTDADGRVALDAPLPGAWLLRGVDLRLSETLPDRFDSRFVTLAFEVPRQNGISASPNARSTNQPPATSTISTEPPTNTARR